MGYFLLLIAMAIQPAPRYTWEWWIDYAWIGFGIFVQAFVETLHWLEAQRAVYRRWEDRF